MDKPRLHLLGLPHTVTAQAYSHCAYTGKVLRFPRMMALEGYDVIHYGNPGAEVDCEHVDVLPVELFEKLCDKRPPTAFVGDIADTGTPLFKAFNICLQAELKARWVKGDLVCLPFGHAHNAALEELGDWAKIEIGIGYPTLGPARYRVYESNAWYHWHLGKGNRAGSDYEWIVPNYFDVKEWPFIEVPSDYVLFFGRLTQLKGLEIVKEIALALPEQDFILCGQGEDPKWDLKNVEYRAPISGFDRAALVGNASVVIMPTRYIEPFGGVSAEAQMCGTPVLGSSFGAFTETIEHGRTGYRCRTLGDWVEAVGLAKTLNRSFIRERAVSLWGLTSVARAYDKVFMQIQDLWGEGWYSKRSALV